MFTPAPAPVNGCSLTSHGAAFGQTALAPMFEGAIVVANVRGSSMARVRARRHLLRLPHALPGRQQPEHPHDLRQGFRRIRRENGEGKH